MAWEHICNLEDCLDALIDYRGKTPRKTDFGIPLITAKVVKSGHIGKLDEFIPEEDYETWMKRGYPKIGDVVLTTEAPLGEVAQIKFLPVALAQRIVTLRGKQGVLDSGYLLYLMQSQEMQEKLLSRSSGTTVIGIKQSELRKIEVALPSVSEQRAIAHILGTLDDKIELNRRQSETLQEMARALFKAWFVDFEPVRAKMSGRWQRGQTLPGLPAHLWDLFPDRLVETEHGEVPQGWTCTPFGNLLESTIGGDWGKESLDGDYSEIVSIIRGTDFPDIVSGVVGKVPVRYTTLKRLNARELRSGDIVVEISGGSPKQPTGRSLYISDDVLRRFDNAVVCASFCRRFRPKDHELGVLAFLHLQNLYSVGGTWGYQNQSTGIANFQTTRFLNDEKVVVPQVDILREFSNYATPMLEKISSNENMALAALRNTLLPQLLSGALRVPDAEKFLQERGL